MMNFNPRTHVECDSDFWAKRGERSVFCSKTRYFLKKARTNVTNITKFIRKSENFRCECFRDFVCTSGSH